MKNLRRDRFAWVGFSAFAVCFILVASISNTPVVGVFSVLKIAYRAIPLVVAAAGFFVGYAWRWPIFRGWLVPFPNLNGTWQGTIQTTWKNPATGVSPGPIPVILTIKQSFIRISCVMRTAEMTSRSYLADFWLDENEQIRKLGYSYRSDPRPTVAHRSAPHDGTTVFEIIGTPTEKLQGVYWTARQTTGEIHLVFRCRKLLEEIPSDLGTHPLSAPS